MSGQQGYVTIFGDTLIVDSTGQAGGQVINATGTPGHLVKFETSNTVNDSLLTEESGTTLKAIPTSGSTVYLTTDGSTLNINAGGDSIEVAPSQLTVNYDTVVTPYLSTYATGVDKIVTLDSGSQVKSISVADFKSDLNLIETISAGSGISVTGTSNLTIGNTGVLSFNGSTGAVTGVESAIAGTGITMGGTAENLIVTNSGVTSLTAGTGISLSGSTGNITVTATTSGTIGGSGTTSSIPKFTGTQTIGDSCMSEISGGIGLTINSGSTEAYVQSAVGQNLVFLPGGGSSGVTITTLGDTAADNRMMAANIGSAGSGQDFIVKGSGVTIGSGTYYPLESRSLADVKNDLDVVDSAIAGTGISVSSGTGNVTFTNTGVTSATAGTGISVSSGTGAVSITNTGVTSLTAGTGISLSGSTGAITVTNTSTGTIGGSGTAGFFSKFSSSNAITDAPLYDNVGSNLVGLYRNLWLDTQSAGRCDIVLQHSGGAQARFYHDGNTHLYAEDGDPIWIDSLIGGANPHVYLGTTDQNSRVCSGYQAYNLAAQNTMYSPGTGTFNNSEYSGTNGLILSSGTTSNDQCLYFGVNNTGHYSYMQSVHYGTASSDLYMNARGGALRMGTSTNYENAKLVVGNDTGDGSGSVSVSGWQSCPATVTRPMFYHQSNVGAGIVSDYEFQINVNGSTASTPGFHINDNASTVRRGWTYVNNKQYFAGDYTDNRAAIIIGTNNSQEGLYYGAENDTSNTYSNYGEYIWRDAITNGGQFMRLYRLRNNYNASAFMTGYDLPNFNEMAHHPICVYQNTSFTSYTGQYFNLSFFNFNNNFMPTDKYGNYTVILRTYCSYSSNGNYVGRFKVGLHRNSGAYVTTENNLYAIHRNAYTGYTDTSTAAGANTGDYWLFTQEFRYEAQITNSSLYRQYANVRCVGTVDAVGCSQTFGTIGELNTGSAGANQIDGVWLQYDFFNSAYRTIHVDVQVIMNGYRSYQF